MSMNELKQKAASMLGYKDYASASGGAKMIIMFLVIVLIFTGVFGTIAHNLWDLENNTSVAHIPGGTALVAVIGIIIIAAIIIYFVKRAM